MEERDAYTEEIVWSVWGNESFSIWLRYRCVCVLCVCMHICLWAHVHACLEEGVCITKEVPEICVWNSTISNILLTCSYVMRVILETIYVSP